MTQQNQTINVDLNSLQVIKCPTCKGKSFTQTYELRYLPRILSPSNQPGIIKVPMNLCDYCTAIFTDEQLISKHNGDIEKLAEGQE